jgi:hypothetical protein
MEHRAPVDPDPVTVSSQDPEVDAYEEVLSALL